MSVPALSIAVQGQSQTSADNLNTYIQGCNIVTDLRNFVGITGLKVFMAGYTSIGDGGQGYFYWNASGSHADDNGVTTIVPNGAASGEWTRLLLSAGLGAAAFENLGNNIVDDGVGNLVIKTSAAIAGSPTTTTQSGSDNSIKIATTAQVQAAIALAAPTFHQQIITATNTFTFTAPSNTKSNTVFKFTLTGGGGSGADYFSSSFGSSGAAGGTVIWYVSGLVATTVYSGVIGVGGTSTSSSPSVGNAGVNSTFTVGVTTITAGGGAGGVITDTRCVGGSATFAANMISIGGGDGQLGCSSASGPSGAASYWGQGGSSLATANASQGEAWGSGGGASSNGPSGAGQGGIFIAEWIL